MCVSPELLFPVAMTLPRHAGTCRGHLSLGVAGQGAAWTEVIATPKIVRHFCLYGRNMNDGIIEWHPLFSEKACAHAS